MPKFRKKPVIIEAFHWTGDNHWDDWPEWLRTAYHIPFEEPGSFYSIAGASWYLSTLEGQHHVSSGDYIIRGVQGELYPCKPDGTPLAVAIGPRLTIKQVDDNKEQGVS